MISKHQEEVTKLERREQMSEGADEEIESHRESVQALQNSLTPAEINQLSTLSNRLAKWVELFLGLDWSLAYCTVLIFV